jgi:hypothetical protein
MIPSFGQHVHDRDRIVRASGAADVWLTSVEPPAIAFILESARSKYTDGKRGWVWEHFTAPFAAAGAPEAIDWIAEYARTRPEPPLLFLWDSDVMFEVKDGVELTLLLDEDYPSEFCVTNAATDYLLCASHEQWVYALGAALSWFERRSRVADGPD